MSDTPKIPADMVERAARVLHEHDRVHSIGEPDFDGLEPEDRESYLAVARAVLATVPAGAVERLNDHG